MLALPFDLETLAHHVHVVDPAPDADGRAALHEALARVEPTIARASVVLPDGDDPEVERFKGLNAAIVRAKPAPRLRRTRHRVDLLESLGAAKVRVHGLARDRSWAKAAGRIARPSPPAEPATRPYRDDDRLVYVLKTDLGHRAAHVAQAKQTVLGLAAAGRAVTLLAPLADGPLDAALADAGVTHRPLPELRRRPSSARAVERALAELADEGHGVVYFRQVRIASMILPAARRLGFRTFMEAHQPYATWALAERRRLGALDGRPMLLGRRDRWYEQRAYLELDGVVCTTRAMRRRVTALAPGRPTLLLRNGAPPVVDAPPVEKDVDVLYAGRTDAVKGTDVLIEALARHGSATATIVGGPTEDDLAPHRARVAALGLDDRVTFAGWEDQARLFERVRRARMVVHPLPGRGSREWRLFTCPLKLLEAMSLGTPVVATDLPAVREIVRDGVTGVLVAPGDPTALADGIGRVLDDDACAARLATAARRRVARIDRDARAARLAAFLDEVRR